MTFQTSAYGHERSVAAAVASPNSGRCGLDSTGAPKCSRSQRR